MSSNKELREKISREVFKVMVKASRGEPARDGLEYTEGGNSSNEYEARRVSDTILDLIENHFEDNEILFDEL